MSTSSIYYPATDVPMRNESWHAEQAFKSYELGGELWLSCVLSIVTACVVFFSLSTIDSINHPNIVFEIVAKICLALMWVLIIGCLVFATTHLMYRKYYSKLSHGKVELYRIDIIEPNDDNWGIQFTSPNGVFTYLNLGRDPECITYVIELLQFDAEFRKEINSYLADPVKEKVATENMITSKYKDLCGGRNREDSDPEPCVNPSTDDDWNVDDDFV
ncbi:MAG: hypothetical protein ACFNZO_00730 [Candidatus Saccharibacteria bacterium]